MATHGYSKLVFMHFAQHKSQGPRSQGAPAQRRLDVLGIFFIIIYISFVKKIRACRPFSTKGNVKEKDSAVFTFFFLQAAFSTNYREVGSEKVITTRLGTWKTLLPAQDKPKNGAQTVDFRPALYIPFIITLTFLCRNTYSGTVCSEYLHWRICTYP